MIDRDKFSKSTIYSLFLISVLIAVYTLTYSGTFTTDDEHILASRSLSMAFDDSINDYRVLGNSRVYTYFNLDPDYGEQSLNIEPMQAVLGSQLAKLANTLQWGKIQTIFFLNIFLTAFTAGAIFWILVLLSFNLHISLTTGFLFGLCTMAWPYSKTYFRDPAAMFFITLSWGAALLLTSRKAQQFSSKKSNVFLWIVFVVSIFFGILSKNSTMLALPVFLIMFIQHWREAWAGKSRIEKKEFKIIFTILTLVLISVITIWIFLPRQSGQLSRFTAFYYSTVFKNIFSNPRSHLIEGILGPIFSPGKSIFLYSPVLILAVIGLIRYFKKSYLAWLYFFFLVIVQALYYDSIWWGSVNWGLRYLLPTLPIFLITCAPIIEDIYNKTIKFPLLQLIIISLLIQVIGIWIPAKDFFISMAKSTQEISHTEIIWKIQFSHIWWNLSSIIRGGMPDIAAWRIGLSILPAVTLVILGLVMYIHLYRKKFKPRFILSGIFLLLIFLGFFLSQVGNDPIYKPRSDLSDSHNAIREYYSAEDFIFIRTYGTPLWLYWMNWSDPELKWISVSPVLERNPTSNISALFGSSNAADNQQMQKFLDHLSLSGNQTWLVSPSESSGKQLQIGALEDILHYQTNQKWEYSTIDQTIEVFLLVPQ
ncbi:hypothetical protein ACFLXB_06725 [Chloroflexota bacterium]